MGRRKGGYMFAKGRQRCILALALALGLALIMFSVLSLAHEQASRENEDADWVTLAVHIEEQRNTIAANQLVSQAVRIEPAQFQFSQKVPVEARVPLTSFLEYEAQVTDHYRTVRPLKRGFKTLIGRTVDEAHSVPLTVPTTDVGSSDVRAAAECEVNSTADSNDPGTLRHCLENAVAGDTITFDANVFPPTSPATISPLSELPWIITDDLTIDASNAGVILDGSGLSSGDGLTIAGASHVRIWGLQILRFPLYGVSIITGTMCTTIGGERGVGSGSLGQGNLISGNRWGAGVRIEGVGTVSNTIQGNHIGTDISGRAALGNILAGVVVFNGAANNIIGGDTPTTRNLISGNQLTGIWIEGTGTSGNQVLGNYIGTNISGTDSIGHSWDGVFIGFGAEKNVISGNLIGGSGNAGIWVQGVGTSENQVIGNHIGTDVSGTDDLPNHDGVCIQGGATDNVIGGNTTGTRNLISGNSYHGISISGSGTSKNCIVGNYIGTNISGMGALGNGAVGVIIMAGATDNTIGGNALGNGNLISGNELDGIFIQDSGTPGNQVMGNYIGTNISGTAPLGNRNGIVIADAMDNIIGGETAGTRNLISGNRDAGIWMQRAETFGNRVLGNYIGTNGAGTDDLGNGSFGVLIGFGATNNVIGGPLSGARNLISGNGSTGVHIQNSGTMSNVVLGNYIGIDVSGMGLVSLGNGESGVTIHDGAASNIIGGDTPEARNIVSGNKGDAGVEISGVGTMGNIVLGNYIGTDVYGATSVANVEHGVVIHGGAMDNTVGGTSPQERNLISGNGQAGVVLYGSGTWGNRVIGNYIGTGASGTTRVPNLWGVFIGEGATNNTVGGILSGTYNLISGNNEAGVRVEGTGTMSNTVLGNYVGVDVSGTFSLSNEYGVVIGFGATNNTVGGRDSQARNLISGNREAGVVVWGERETLGNQVLGNYIGTDASGITFLPNRWGVYIAEGATDNVIGADPDAGNLISGNKEAGVWIRDAGTSHNRIPGNLIAANIGYGVFIGFGATHNTVGISNTIIYNGLAGVVIEDPYALYNTITRNTVYENGGLPIDWDGQPVPIPPPVIDGFSFLTRTVRGDACIGCCVEIFANPTISAAGTVFLGDAVAGASGHFGLPLKSLPPFSYLSATETNPDGTTSEFSSGIHVVFHIYLPLVVRSR